MFLTLLLITLGSQTSMAQRPASESADIVLLIDSSDALGRRAFPPVKSFVNRLINSFPIGANRYRFALVQYSDDVKVEFHLDDYKAKNPMLNHLKRVSFKGGPLRTGHALHSVHETFFRRLRKDRNQIVVMTTSAMSNDPVEEAARQLRKNGIKIIALGIQDAIPEEVQSIATPPFYYKFATTRDLLAFSQNMSEVIGKAIQMEISTATPTPALSNVTESVTGTVGPVPEEALTCLEDSVADVAFIVDEGVSQANGENIREFLQNIVNSLDVKEECIRMGIVAYSTEAKILTSLRDKMKKTDILKKIKSFSPKEGKSHLGAAINITTRQVFPERRRSAEQVATIITHRPSDDDVRGAASLISSAGVTVFAIGVEEADSAQLSQIVSYPPESNIIKVAQFSDLPKQDKTFQKKLFNQIKDTLYVQPQRRIQLKSGCADTEKADIYFLLDDSSSIPIEEFKKMKTFLMEAIKLFTIGPDNVRFGVVQYSKNTILPIRLGQHTTRITLEKEINNIQHRAQTETNTGAALNFTRPLFKDARQQCRGNVPCYLIVLTDGEAHDDVKVAARLLRNANVNIYAIGVKEANEEELLHIAGTKSRVYFVQQFDALEKIKNVVVRDICHDKACEERKVDVMFLVDSSGSISSENFGKMQNFMTEFVKKSNIGPEQMCVGAVQFSGAAVENFPLNMFLTENKIVEAIKNMSLIGANTLTGEALAFISNYFEPAKGARPGVHKVLILITDGEAQDEVKSPAQVLRDKGITIYSVGVFNANKTQLEEISGKPDRVFYVENFDVLNKVQDELRFGVCNPEEECKRIERLDIVFVIDSSSSIGPVNYNHMKDFMIGIVNKSAVGKELVQFGALKYSDDPYILFDLDDHSTKAAVIDAIQSETLLGGNTYTAEALEHSKILFTEARGSRKRRGVSQILMVITDGESHDTERLEDVSKKIRDDKITIMAVGVKDAKPAELLTIAGSKENQYFVDTFEGLQNISLQLSDNLCKNSTPECEIHVDLVFLIDGSKSISSQDFKMMKDFLRNLLDLIDYDNNVRVGMAQFGDQYKEEFGLGTYQSKAELQEKIINVTRMNAVKTYIGKALKEVKAFFNSTRRRIPRHTVPKLLLITDGDSADPVADSAKALAADGVEIHAVGVGKVKQAKLMEITDDPDRIYSVANFKELPNILTRVTKEVCSDESEATCFMDVVIGFDISSQKVGDNIFSEQHLLETSLSDILKDLTSYGAVSCNKGTKTQFSVANLIENTDTPFLRTLQVDHEKILEDLQKVRLNGPSYLNVKFLDNLWNLFENVSGNHMRSQVLLVFSDGLDADKEVVKKKSEELRKKGLDGLITVALEGVTNFEDLRDIEFGKRFGYNKQLSMGTQNIASQLFAFVSQIAEKTCCCKFCTCMQEEGPHGTKGKMGPQGLIGLPGHRGYTGEDGEPGSRGFPGPEGPQGYRGEPGSRGMKGLQGRTGRKGEKGDDGLDGILGEEGSPGLPGHKGEKGDAGLQGSPGPSGLPGDEGQKGFRGDPGDSGLDVEVEGAKGYKGSQGSRGDKGSRGFTGENGSAGNNGPEGRRGLPGPPGTKGNPGPRGLEGKPGFDGQQGTSGIPGEKGEKGHSGNKGFPGNLGIPGPKGNQGKPGPRGAEGEPGNPGVKGARGPRGPQGTRGDEGIPGYGAQGKKGSKGEEGFPGDIGIQGAPGDPGLPGEPGPKGVRGRMGTPGLKGEPGSPGAWGPPGRSGPKGEKGLSSFSPCELIEYLREHSPCWTGTLECPVYPTELVFALDVSQDTTPQIFEQMREMVMAIVNNTQIRESNCPVGARVAVVSYSSDTHYLIRFSDFHNKQRLLQELTKLSYRKSTTKRDTGAAMRFVARNMFKRTLPGANVRKVAVFFSNGQSDNADSLSTAVLEFSAFDIHPAVIAFKNIPSINRAFAIDDTRLFQLITIQPQRDYTSALQKLQSCVLCYDKCKPDSSCFRPETPRARGNVDAAFILENSRKMTSAEFQKLKDFLSTALDGFDVSAEPEASLTGDRVAVLSHAPPEFRPQTQRSPVKVEFDLLTYNSKIRMKRHIQESIQQMNGTAAVGHAIQWAVSNIFSEAPNQRKHKAIFVVSVGETSRWDKEVLGDAAFRAKCLGYALFVLSLGDEYDEVEIEALASLPLEHHLVQLGRIHKAELNYAVKFLKPFLRLLKSEINKYPQAQLKRKCASISDQKPLYGPPKRSFAIGSTMSSETMLLDAESAFREPTPYDFVTPGNPFSSGQQIVVPGN